LHKKSKQPITRIVRRHAKPGCEKRYEATIHAMLDELRHTRGYMSGMIIPPAKKGGEYQIVHHFASNQDLERWNVSEERATWHERLRPLAEDPEYHLLTGLEAWFSPKLVLTSAPPQRWRMTFVSWLGIYPCVVVCLWFISPLLDFLPFLIRIALITALVAITMSYVVMPRLSLWMRGWLNK